MTLEIDNLSVEYSRSRGVPTTAINGLSLQVDPGKLAAIVGESGSGKSTTARAIIGLLPHNARIAQGSIRLTAGGPFNTSAPNQGAPSPADTNGRELTNLTSRQWRGIRGREIGYVPQDPGTSLNPLKTVGANVAESLRIHTRMSATQRRARVFELLDAVGIDQPHLRIDQYPHELSGGMRQRVLIAAGIALDPRLLIADEPTSALDVTVQKRILDLLDTLRASTDMAVVLITHDLAVAAERADTLTVVRHGQVEESGPTGTVLAQPASAYTKKLLADAPSLTLQGNPGAPDPGAPLGTSMPPQKAHKSSLPHGTPAPQAPAGTAGTVGTGTSTATGVLAPLVTVEHISRVYARTRDRVTGIDDVSFTIEPGQTLGLVGESGSGKSTVARALAGVTGTDSGSIRVGGLDPAAPGGRARRAYRKAVQLVHQNPTSALDPMHSVGASIAEPLRNFRIGTRADRPTRVAQAMRRVSLDPALAARRPRELSGGQLQRVAIARALVVEPQLVVFDEAVSALDVTVQAQILELITTLQDELNVTYLFISHDLAVVQQIADSVAVMHQGYVVESGQTAQVLENPRSEYTRQLLAAVPRPHAAFSEPA